MYSFDFVDNNLGPDLLAAGPKDLDPNYCRKLQWVIYRVDLLIKKWTPCVYCES